jgi:hypothetical protein
MQRELAVAFAPMRLADGLLLRAGLRAAGIRVRDASVATCDVIIAMDASALPPATRPQVVRVVAGPRHPVTQPTHFIERWPNVAQLADVIAAAEAGRTQGHAVPLPQVPAACASASAGWQPDTVDAWLALVSEATARRVTIRIDQGTAPLAGWHPRTGAGWVMPTAASSLAATMAEAPLKAVLAAEPPPDVVRASQAHVLWALALSQAWTLAAIGLDDRRQVRLSRWPDFGSLERRETFLRVASRLIRAPASPNALMAEHAERVEDVLAFLAGCRLCGWLELTDGRDAATPPLPPTPAAGPLRGTFNRLRRALGLRPND